MTVSTCIIKTLVDQHLSPETEPKLTSYLPLLSTMEFIYFFLKYLKILIGICFLRS